jgi:O-antigen ligase
VPDHFLSLYVFRDASLRATVSSGHQLVWGHYLVVCFGLLTLFRVQFKRFRLVVVWMLLSLAMYSTVSRSPWLAAALVVLLMGLFTGRAFRFYALVTTTAVIASAAALASPWSEKFVNLLPFIGKTDSETIDYREQILETAIIMVQQKPLFGDVHVLENLEHLRQGQGIIDLVNVYAEMAMTFGLIGLGLFLTGLALFQGPSILSATVGDLNVRIAVVCLILAVVVQIGSLLRTRPSWTGTERRSETGSQ